MHNETRWRRVSIVLVLLVQCYCSLSSFPRREIENLNCFFFCCLLNSSLRKFIIITNKKHWANKVNWVVNIKSNDKYKLHWFGTHQNRENIFSDVFWSDHLIPVINFVSTYLQLTNRVSQRRCSCHQYFDIFKATHLERYFIFVMTFS